jgi:hypothetical protein
MKPTYSQKTRKPKRQTTKSDKKEIKQKETIRELKRIIAQLRKQLASKGVIEDNNIISSDVEEMLLTGAIGVTTTSGSSASTEHCANCNSRNVQVIPAGVYIIKQCLDCGMRKRRKANDKGVEI